MKPARSWVVSSLAAAALLLLVTLLLPQASAQALTQGPSSDPQSHSTDSIAPVSPSTAARASTPPWLSGAVDSTDYFRAPRKQFLAGASQQQAEQVISAAATKLPQRFIVQLKLQPAAALVRPSVQSTSAADDDRADAENGGSPRQSRRSRITPQAAAASQAVTTQAQAVAAAAGVTAQVTHSYSYALSGFAIENPTAAQLQALAANPAVKSVTEDSMVFATTYTTPQFLGLARGPDFNNNWRRSKHRPVWDQLGGVLGSNGAGEDIVIGVIDTGAWMPNATCFRDSNYWEGGSYPSRQNYPSPPDWQGVCRATEGTPECNNKVIGCRYYTAGWGGDSTISGIYPYEYLSCRDVDGHGSHTASTAGGNFGGVSDIAPQGSLTSGMAPRARLAIYKALWGRAGAGMQSDLVSAIEDAIKDGVDVINLSATTATDTFREASVMAFMNAARAGIFVAAAAGNDGTQVTVQSIVPWVTTVAASTHDRSLQATLSLGDGQQLIGTGAFPTALGPLPLVYATDVAGIDNITDASLCAPNSLDPRKINGSVIVACDRGTYFLAQKVQEIARIGGRGMVLLNVPGGRTDMFWGQLKFPYVHVTEPQRRTVLQYLEAAGAAASATLEAAKVKQGMTAPAMAGFSSRGPIPVANAVVLKPDITAPGVDIFAAYTGSLLTPFSSLDGTSMASPHIAGIAALLKHKYPNWSPMAIKSALMTTAYQATRTGTTGQPFGTALQYGAGHVDPTAALDPGLVFDSDVEDWQRFLCDVEPFPKDDCATLCAVESRARSAESAANEGDQQAQQVVPSWHKPPKYPPDNGGSPPSLISPPSGPPPEPKAPEQPCNAYNFNGPWISGDISTSITVLRTLTSVVSAREGRVTFTAQGSADAGSSFQVVVVPASFRTRGRQSQRVSITVRAKSDTPMGKHQFGQVVWRSSSGHSVRIPIAVRFSEFVAPEYIRPALRSTSFQQRYRIGANAATTVNIESLGITAAEVTPVPVARVLTYDLNQPGVGKLDISIPEGGSYFAAGIFARDVAALADLDLHLYQGTTLIGKSASDSSTEMLEAVEGLPAGQYTAYIFPFSLPTETATAYVHVWQLPGRNITGGASMQVSPSSVQVAPGDMGCCPITLSFSQLFSDFSTMFPPRYIGVLNYKRQDGKPVSVPRTRVYIL